MGILFPSGLPERTFTEFRADGYSVPVTGVVYRGTNPPTCGMPLGGIDTGCLDVEANGLLGINSIFNSLAPRKGPLNVPFLGMRLGDRTHLMCAFGSGAAQAADIRYWGHYPVLDMEFGWEGTPVTAGVRAWSPFLPGDVAGSNTPGAVFEVRLRNPGGAGLVGTLAFDFPGFDFHENMNTPIRRIELRDTLQGVVVGTETFKAGQQQADKEGGFVLCSEGGSNVRIAEYFGWNADRWNAMAPVPEPKKTHSDQAGIALLTDFTLAPGEEKVLRIVLAWYSPVWFAKGARTAGGNEFRHMYAKRFLSAVEVAEYLVREHESLLARILAWQETVYAEKSLPGWLRDQLINILHLITETGLWAQAKEPIGAWCREEDGLFGLSEDPRTCPQIECIPCSLYGNIPLVYFFPSLALSTLRGYKAYQFEDGRPPWIFGSQSDMASPTKGYQFVLNGSCLVELVDKMWRRTGSDDLLREFYDACKRTTVFTMNLRPDYGERQVISMPTRNAGYEWFETDEPGFIGMTTHVGGIHLAHLLMMERMAERMGDAEFAERCRAWYDAGTRAMEEFLWAGDYYLNYNEPETDRKSELVFGYQLDGHWIAAFHGAGNAFPPERAATVLETVKRCNVANSKSGSVNFANPDGTPAKVGGYGTYSYFPPSLLILSMLYMYNGQKEFGLDLARRCWENIVCKQGLTWDQPNFFRGDHDTGERVYGNDYSQNMMLWSLPAAIEGTDLAGPCRPGGLVDRVVKAAAGKG